jgi:hypothetical protein
VDVELLQREIPIQRKFGAKYSHAMLVVHPIDAIGGRVAGVVPLDFKIRRILLPIHTTKLAISRKKSHNTALSLQSFHTSDNLDLGNTVGVTEDNTDLGRGGTLLGQLADVVDNLLGGGLHPRGSSAGVGDGRGRNALALGVKATHFC